MVNWWIQFNLNSLELGQEQLDFDLLKTNAYLINLVNANYSLEVNDKF